jgi:hypothetical protein
VRTPDFIIGSADSPYIHRWYLIPRNRFFNIYLHKIMRDDDDRALHDHPWWNLSIILKGCYDEVTERGTFRRRRWSLVIRRPTAAHRLVLPTINGGISFCWTLFITGPRIREWGFYCPKGWKHWKDFVNMNNTGEVGPGCGDE